MTRQLLLPALLLLAATLQAATIDPPVAQSERLPADVERDLRSGSQSILPLLQLEPGDRVADVFGGSGYYSELIAAIVGSEGEVLLQNNAAYRAFVGEALTQRFDGRNPGRITLLDSEADDLQLGEAALDGALIVMSYHDLFYDDAENGWPQIDDAAFMGQIHRALKTDGRLLIVDHAAAEGSGAGAAQDLHRIDEAFVIERLSGQGFRLVGSSPALRNPADDRKLSVFDPTIRGNTDRFALVFEKR